MTEQVRKRYRNHRTTIWAAVLAVLLIALAAVPLATGANSKYYTLGASPTNACSTPTTQTFTLMLTNQTRNQSLGSANITAPSYIQLIKETGTSSSGSITVNVPDSFGSTPNTIRLRNLNLPTIGSAATITVQANVSVGSGETWTSVVKQANNFSDSGPGNLFTLSGSAPSATVSLCQYVFVQGPVDASKNVAQTVKVQLQASGNPVSVNGPLTLSASQTVGNTTTAVDANFSGLTSSAPDSSEMYAGKQWTFSVTGNVSGQGYALTAGATTSPTFTIADCIPVNGVCSVGFTDSGDGTGGGAFSGSGLSPNSAIVLSFETIPASGAAICNAGWGWSPLTFPPQPPDGETNFDGITLGTFSMTNKGFMKATIYLRNDLFVQTTASQTNDIQICAGAAHTVLQNGLAANAFMGRNGVPAVFDGGLNGTNLYWGVLARIPNCNKAPDLNNDGILDPALCAWGTQPINGIDYRTATMLIPYDWDWKGGT